MNEPRDPNRTVDVPAAPADMADAGPGAEGVARADSLSTTDQVRDTLRTTEYVAGPADVDPRPDTGAAVGHLPAVPGYRVLREIARGGMGRVLAARDLSLDRDVAVKVLLPGANPGRFVRESKITARLPHPGIPPVHALGTLADGSPFLAMKFIAGRTLTEEMKAADRPPLLQAFTQVCQAVGFAHSRGVIHRDLKPANVMVGRFGEVQVMDWGLAKDVTGGGDPGEPRPAAPALPAAGTDAEQTTDQSPSEESADDRTQAGAVLGTPAYMAPEVAAGEPATRAADVYGLGAILYTLLVGRSPYAGATVADVLKKVRAADPAPFGAAKAPVPPALVAVCRKAMARSPSARYQNAEEVAADVRRWLADEPVSAYREPWAARVARWARGRKTTVVAAAVLLVTTAVAATVTAGLVWREQRQTKVQWERAEGEAAKATENADTAITVVRDLSTYIRLVELSGARQAVTDLQRKLVLDRALSGYERLLALHPDDEQLKATTALTHRFRANLCRALGEAGESEKSFREARRLYGELVSAGNPSYKFDLALTSRDSALLLKTVGRLNEAAEILDGSIPQFEAQLPDGPDRSRQQRVLASMLLDRAELDYPLGRFAETERHARRSAELYADLATRGADPSEPLDPLFHGMAEIRLAVALRELGRVDDALAVHDRVIERFAGIIRSPTGATREYALEYHRAQAERAWTLARLPERRASGLADLDSAIAGFEKLAKQYPQFPAYPRSQGMGTLFRGRLKALLGQPEAAVRDLNAAAKVFEGLVEKYPDLPGYRSYLGQTYTALGQLDRDPMTAVEWRRKAHEMLDGAVRRSPENVLDRQLLAELDAPQEDPRPGPK